MMKLQVVCMILILVITAKNSCCFQGQTANAAGLLTQQMETKEETQGLQALLRRSKRHNSHFPICTYCCKCCRNQGCGFCCRT